MYQVYKSIGKRYFFQYKLSLIYIDAFYIRLYFFCLEYNLVVLVEYTDISNYRIKEPIEPERPDAYLGMQLRGKVSGHLAGHKRLCRRRA